MSKRSFFLLEILVAMAIFALAILPLITLEWGIFRAEIEERKQFSFERKIKNEAIQALVHLYDGETHLKDLKEPFPLSNTSAPAFLLHESEGEDNSLILRFNLPSGQERNFTLPLKITK